MGIYDKDPLMNFSSFHSNNSFFSFGLSAIVYPDNKEKVYAPIVFISRKIKNYQLKVGRWENSLTSESILSTGSLIRSNNSIPIPQISLSTPNYKKYKILKHDIWIKGGFSHGWFSKGEYVKAPLLHEKYFYIKKKFKNNSALSVGLFDEAIWGGETENHGSQPQSLSDYFRVITLQSASKSGLPQEQINALGNHLGVWDIVYTKSYNTQNLKFYFQHPFEDKSSAFQHFFDELKALKFPSKSFDGLYGLELSQKKPGLVSRFLYEYINTMNQSGPQAASDSTYGWDNYYNHYIYQSGWTYNGRVIGNPLFTLGSNPGHYNDGIYIVNNRLIAHHIGLSGDFSSQIKYKLLATFSKNYGIYYDQDRFKKLNKPYKYNGGIKQISALLEFNFTNVWENLDLRISYAIDRGKHLGNSDGYLVSFIYNFSNLSRSH